MKVVASAVLSIVLHLTLGWAWTAGAGMVAGFWVMRRGALVGALAVGMGWAALVAWNFAAAPQQVAEMSRVVGSLMGGLPPIAATLATIVLGMLLGGSGGAVGAQAARILERAANTAATTP